MDTLTYVSIPFCYFFFDDRNSVYDRIMLAPSFPNVTLHGKRVLK